MSNGCRKPVGLDVLGAVDWAEMEFRSADLAGLAERAEDAAAVPAKYKGERESVRCFKLICSINAQQLGRADAAVQERIRDFGAEKESERVLAALARECGDEVQGADPEYAQVLYGLALACVLEPRGDFLGELEGGAAERDRVKRMAVRLDKMMTRPDDNADAAALYALRRKHAECVEMLERPSLVEVVRFRWAEIPSALSGGYLRALGWMWAELPPEIEAAFSRLHAATKVGEKP